MDKITITPESLKEFASSIVIIDPRIERCKVHTADSIVFLSLAAVICGSQTWNDIEDFGTAKEDFFKSHLPNWNGVPSHDTINRFFSAIGPDKFEEPFREWIGAMVCDYKGVIAFDGKTVRGGGTEVGRNGKAGKNGGACRSKLHLVSAYATEYGISLGQMKVDEKSNEITAVPELIDAVFIPGCIFTADAMHCQKKTALRVLEKGGDYILMVKGNQKGLHEWLQKLMRDCISKPRRIRDDTFSTRDEGHGRVERRTCHAMGDMSYMHRFKDEWPGMKCVGCVVSERIDYHNNTDTTETRYFISSLESNAEKLLKCIREHWQIENGLHWHLDVNFKEDADRKRNNAAQNFSLLGKVALAILKNDGTKRPLNRKRLFAGWNDEYLWKLLTKKEEIL